MPPRLTPFRTLIGTMEKVVTPTFTQSTRPHPRKTKTSLTSVLRVLVSTVRIWVFMIQLLMVSVSLINKWLSLILCTKASDLLKNLSLDSQAKTTEIHEPTKKVRYFHHMSSMDAGNGLVQPTNRSVTPLILDFMDPTMAYYPNGYASSYYYGVSNPQQQQQPKEPETDLTKVNEVGMETSYVEETKSRVVMKDLQRCFVYYTMIAEMTMLLIALNNGYLKINYQRESYSELGYLIFLLEILINVLVRLVGPDDHMYPDSVDVRDVEFGLGIRYNSKPKAAPPTGSAIKSLRTGVMPQFKSSFVAASTSSNNYGNQGSKKMVLSGFVSGGINFKRMNIL
ncbi:unnamed protein product [Lactuca saligna]|uniref:Uncharacterized protein n=1 Tax=Lactuca saligna TaxID=75948 RepID=A0AA35UX98_LACSI|nr:unnamed protein product [Lactuca saligna]